MINEEAREIMVKLNNKEMMCKYTISPTNEKEENPLFKAYFNSNGSEEDLFVKDVETPLNQIDNEIKRSIIAGEVESVQVMNTEDPSIFNNVQIDYESVKNLLMFFSKHRDSILRGEVISLEGFNSYKKISRVLVHNESVVYFPAITVDWCIKSLLKIEGDMSNAAD